MNLFLPLLLVLVAPYLSNPLRVAKPPLPQDLALGSQVGSSASVVELLSRDPGNANLVDEVLGAVNGASPRERTSEPWRTALELAVLDPRMRWEFPRLIKRLSESFELAGDFEAGLARLAYVQGALPDLRWLELRQLEYLAARFRRAAGMYIPANVTLTRLIAEDPPNEREAEPDSIRRWLDGLIRHEHVLSTVETGQIRYAARLASEGIDDLLLARIHVERRRYPSALRVLERYQSAYPARRPIACEYLRGLALWRLGQLEDAKKRFEAVVDRTDASASLVESARIALGSIGLDLGDLELTRKMVLAVEDQAHVAPLLAIRLANLKERRGAILGLAAAEMAPLLEGVRVAYDQWLETWKNSPLVPSGLEFLGSRRREDVLADVIQAELRGPDGAVAALQRVLDAQLCGTTGRRMDAQATTVEDLCRYLRHAGGGAVIFAPGPTETVVFVAQGDGVTSHRASPRTALVDRNREVENLLRRQERHAAGLGSPLARLTSELLPTRVIEHVSHWPHVRFVGLEVMTPAPAAMLVLPEGGWLGCAKKVTEWPSVPVAMALARRSSPDRSVCLALIEPSQDSDDRKPALRFSPAEKERLRSVVGSSGSVVEGAAVTAHALRSAAGGVAYIHCHGRSELTAPRPGRLILGASPGGTSAEDLEAALAGEQSPGHVFIGACSVGRGRRSLGEDGADHLGAALLISGAKSVVISSVDLFHEPTKELALRHLRRLRKGADVGRSMLETRRSMVAEGYDPLDVLSLRVIGVVE